MAGQRTEAQEPTRRPLADEVAERLQARILSGSLAPGDRLPSERELAQELQVNRSSVREALKKLEQLRLIDIQQGSGIRVRQLEEASFDLVRNVLFQGGKLDRAWLADLLELREALLPVIVRMALERSTQTQRDHAAELLQTSVASALSDEDYAKVALEAQNELARMTGNRVMIMLANSVGQFMRNPFAAFLRDTVVRERERFDSATRRLAVAIQAGDAETADRAVRELLRRINESILRAVDAMAAGR